MFADIPASLTYEGLEAYRAQGYEVVPTDFKPTARPEWGMWECIRELVQNALDETERYTLEDTPEGVLIGDQGKGFSVQAFLLGGDEKKPKPLWQRGRFGEGMKLGALASLRKGHRFSFESVGIEGAATIAPRRILGHEVTVMQWVLRQNTRQVGSRFLLRGWHETFAGGFWQSQGAWWNVPSILFPGPPASPYRRMQGCYAGKSGLDKNTGVPVTAISAGHIYARDIYMGLRETKLAYNLWDFGMAPDRHGPLNEYEMRQAVGNFWAQVTSVAMMQFALRTIADVAAGGAPKETLEAQMIFTHNAEGKLRENAHLWQQAWHKELPRAVIRTRSGIEQQLAHIGYTSISFVSQPWSEFLPTDVGTVKLEGIALDKGTIPVPDGSLTVRERKVLGLIQTAVSRLEADAGLGREGGVKGVRAVTFLDSQVEGTWDPVTRQINIGREYLSSFYKASNVLIHEYAHYASAAHDGDEAHTQMISIVGALLTKLVILERLPSSWYEDIQDLGGIRA